MAQSLLERIVSGLRSYRHGDSKSAVEIELRTLISEKKARELIAVCVQKHTCNVSQSINFVNNQRYIASLPYIDNKKQPLNFYKKIAILNDVFFVMPTAGANRIKLAANVEEPVDTIDIKNVPEARIKIRFSADISPQWRLDITLSKFIPNLIVNTEALKAAREKLITARTVENFDVTAPWSEVDQIEYELEYIGAIDDLSQESIKTAIGLARIHVFDDDNSAGDGSSLYQEKIYEIAKLVRPKVAHKFKRDFGMKQLSNQVQELNKNIFVQNVLPHVDDYYITPKLDGKRTLIYAAEGKIYAINDTITELSIDNKEVLESIYVFDTEFYNSSYYIFDVLVWDRHVITEDIFKNRIVHFAEARKRFDGVIKIKAFKPLNDSFKEQIANMIDASEKIYEIDGIILTPMKEKYNEMIVYKYKPPEKLTIDFLIKRCPQKLLGLKPFEKRENKTLYLLFCGISLDVFKKFRMELTSRYEDIFPNINKMHLPQYFPIQFEPSERKYNFLYYADAATDSGAANISDTVGEFTYDTKMDEWKLLRIREDRDVEVKRGNYFGNNFKIAEIIWMNIIDPLIIPQMDAKGYFEQHDNEAFRPVRSYNSFVKSTMLKNVSDEKSSKWVIDLACGKGQDLFRYATQEIENVLFIDNDIVALQELIDRKYGLLNDRTGTYSPMNVLVKRLDLTQPYAEVTRAIEESYFGLPKCGVGIIVCNFALHYFLSTKRTAKNIFTLISRNLAIGGSFIFTCFSGKAILQRLNGKVEWKKGQYHIKTATPLLTMQPYGQEIEVLLPFSGGKFYTEYLVNIESIKEDMQGLHMHMEFERDFASFLQLYSRQNKKGYESLTADDIDFVSLYSAYKFTKTR